MSLARMLQKKPFPWLYITITRGFQQAETLTLISRKETMQDLMYELPSDKTVTQCLVTEDMVKGTGSAVITHLKKPA